MFFFGGGVFIYLRWHVATPSVKTTHMESRRQSFMATLSVLVLKSSFTEKDN